MLRNSGALFLPSETLLQGYKNCVDQHPGISEQMLQWLHAESNRLKSEKNGGLIIDEMYVQEDLQTSFAQGKVSIDGLVDMGQFCEDMSILNTHKKDLHHASCILQFEFLGYDGFRFPIAYFPSSGATASELYINVRDVINKLSEIEFNIDYVRFDGGNSKRAFQFMHFKDKEDAKLKNYTIINPFYPNQKVTVIMDYSHNVKKIRNNIYSSGDHDTCTRKLKLNSQYIVWQHWIQAYIWDRSHNTMHIHQKLTDEHIYLTKASKCAII